MTPGPETRYPPMTVPSRAAVVATIGGLILLVVCVAAAAVMPIFVIGLVLAYVIDPPVTALAARGVPRWLGTILMLLAVGLFVLLFVAIVIGTIVRQGADFAATAVSALTNVQTWVAALSLPEPIRDAIVSAIGGVLAAIGSIDVGAVVGAIGGALIGLLDSVVGSLALAFFMFFVVKDRPALQRAFIERLPDPWRADIVAVARLVVGQFGRYVRSEALLVAVVAVVTWAGLTVLGLVVDPRIGELVIFLAAIAAVAELIPVIGPWIALLPAVVLAVGMGPVALVAVVVLYLAISFLEGNVLVPTLQGRSFEIHPAIVAPLILVALALFGPLGAILALPVAGAARDVQVYAFRRAAGLMEAPPVEPEVAVPAVGPTPTAGAAAPSGAGPAG